MPTVEVILTQKQRGIGNFGQRKRVKVGFFSNFLLPNGMAILATKKNEEYFNQLKKKEDARLVEVKNSAEEMKKILDQKSITITAASQENGRLYGSVTPTSIAHHIHVDFKVDIDARSLEIASPIKQLGETIVKIDLHPEVEIAVTVNVVPEVKEVAQGA
jgi:large subunit ribosomal protein L9